MKVSKNTQEAKDLMKKVREARQKKPTVPKVEGKALPEPEPDGNQMETQEEPVIDLPQNKFMLLLNLIMSIQDDIDFIMSKVG